MAILHRPWKDRKQEASPAEDTRQELVTTHRESPPLAPLPGVQLKDGPAGLPAPHGILAFTPTALDPGWAQGPDHSGTPKITLGLSGFVGAGTGMGRMEQGWKEGCRMVERRG